MKPGKVNENKEKPDEHLTNPYAETKAISEDIVLDSGLRGLVFRLGVLVGDDDTGNIEKLDGPYSFLNIFKLISERLKMRNLPLVILPGHKKSLLPIVGVCDAAKVFATAVKKDFSTMEICGVYREDSPTTEMFTKLIIKPYFPYAFIKFTGLVPSVLLKHQQKLTGVSKSAIDYLSYTQSLENKNFQKLFPECSLKGYNELTPKIIEGFESYIKKA